MPKREKLKAKATGSTTTCEFQKSLCLVLAFCSKPSYCKTTLLWGGGEKFDYGEEGEFFAFDQNQS
jgi:hypothetical protein